MAHLLEQEREVEDERKATMERQLAEARAALESRNQELEAMAVSKAELTG